MCKHIQWTTTTKSFGPHDRQPHKNLHTAISLNKPKLSVTKHDQTLIWAHMYDTSRYTANAKMYSRILHSHTHTHIHTDVKRWVFKACLKEDVDAEWQTSHSNEFHCVGPMKEKACCYTICIPFFFFLFLCCITQYSTNTMPFISQYNMNTMPSISQYSVNSMPFIAQCMTVSILVLRVLTGAYKYLQIKFAK